MNRVGAQISTLTAVVTDTLEAAAARRRPDDEHGGVTLEVALWAAALIGLAAVVYGVMEAFVNTKSSEIR